MKEKTVYLPKEKQTVVIRFAVMVLSVLIILTSLTACGGNPESSTPSAPETTTTTTTETATTPEEELVTTTITTASRATTTSAVSSTRKPTTTTTSTPPRDIAYTVKGMVRVDKREEERVIIRTKEQLDALKLEERQLSQNSDKRIDTSVFTEAYFREKALVMFEWSALISDELSVGQVTLKEELLTVQYIIKGAMIDLDMSVRTLVLLEVDRADVAAAKELKIDVEHVKGPKSTKPTTTATTSLPPRDIAYTVKGMVPVDEPKVEERVIIRTKEQLDALKLEERQLSQNSDKRIDTSVFTEAYFREKTLVMFEWIALISDELSVGWMRLEGERLTVQYIIKQAMIDLEASGCTLVLLEVDRADVTAAKELKIDVEHVKGPKSTKPTTATTSTPPREIAYTVKEQVYSGSGTLDGSRILRDREALSLLAAKLDAETLTKGNRPYKVDLSAYDDAYFADKALAFLEISGSSSHRMRVDKLLVDDELMTVDCTLFRPPFAADDVTYCYVLLELDPADVEAVTKLTFDRTTLNVSYEEMPE